MVRNWTIVILLTIAVAAFGFGAFGPVGIPSGQIRQRVSTTVATTTTTTIPFTAYTNLVGQWISNISASDAAAGVYPDPINSLDGTQATASARGTYTNAHGGGITLDGGDWVEVADDILLSLISGGVDAPRSFVFFGKPASTTPRVMLGKRDDSLGVAEYLIQVDANSDMASALFDGTTSIRRQRHSNVALQGLSGNDIMFTFAYDGRGGTDANDGMINYTNASILDVVDNNAGTYIDMEDTAAKFYIGAYMDASSPDNAYNWQGDIYDVMLFDKELTLTEITNILDYVENN